MKNFAFYLLLVVLVAAGTFLTYHTGKDDYFDGAVLCVLLLGFFKSLSDS
jgi:hypothetical protein